jgi:hypothetical protein
MTAVVAFSMSMMTLKFSVVRSLGAVLMLLVMRLSSRCGVGAE